MNCSYYFTFPNKNVLHGKMEKSKTNNFHAHAKWSIVYFV